jgi:hypothetical protein
MCKARLANVKHRVERLITKRRCQGTSGKRYCNLRSLTREPGRQCRSVSIAGSHLRGTRTRLRRGVGPGCHRRRVARRAALPFGTCATRRCSSPCARAKCVRLSQRRSAQLTPPSSCIPPFAPGASVRSGCPSNPGSTGPSTAGSASKRATAAKAPRPQRVFLTPRDLLTLPAST